MSPARSRAGDPCGAAGPFNGTLICALLSTQAYIISRGEKALKHWDYTLQRLNSAWSTLGVQKTEPVFGHYQVPHNSNASCFIEGIVRPCRPGDHQVEMPPLI